jgi:hypothetical protein
MVRGILIRFMIQFFLSCVRSKASGNMFLGIFHHQTTTCSTGGTWISTGKIGKTY